MSADTETIREALESARRLQAEHQRLSDGEHGVDAWSRFRDDCVVFVFSFPAAALGRVEEQHAELVRRSEALEASIVRNGGRLLNEHAWNAWVTEVARARAALSSVAARSGEE